MDKRILAGGLAVTVALGAWFALRGTDTPPASDPAPRPAGELSPEQLARLGIRTEPARAETEVPLGVVPGLVTLPPEARVAVTSPFAGTAVQVLAIAGQQVVRGQALALVRAAEPVRFGGDLARAEAEVELARANARRLEALAREGVVAGVRADQATAALRGAEATLAESRRLLAMAGADRAGTVTLRAPIAGRIASAAIETGGTVGSGPAPFVIENVAALRLDLQLPEALAPQVRPGMALSVPQGTGPALRGRVIAVAASIDPATRSVTARGALDGGAMLAPGKSVSVVIAGAGAGTASGLSVPAAAVTRIDGHDTVFVRTAKGFARRVVTVASEAQGRAYLSGGLKLGEPVATSGVAELKSLLGQ